MLASRIELGSQNSAEIPYCSNRSKLFRRIVCKLLIFGAGDGGRTRDVQLGKMLNNCCLKRQEFPETSGSARCCRSFHKIAPFGVTTEGSLIP